MKPSLPIHTSPGIKGLVFILGHPLGHTLSPAMQNAAFRKAKLPWLYTPLDLQPDQVAGALEVLRFPWAMGANVTVPYKEAVLSRLDSVEPEARWLGSVNTIFRRGNRLCGASTDGEGFLRSLGPWRKRLTGSKVLIVGAGGAAKAVAGAVVKSGVQRCDISNRSKERSVRLVRNLRKASRFLEAQALSLAEAERELGAYDWIIQATSIGLKKEDPSPLSLAGAERSALAVDLIYHRRTAFLAEAARRGMPHLGGMGMLLHQGALAYQRWTGKKAPLTAMRTALLYRLASPWATAPETDNR